MARSLASLPGPVLVSGAGGFVGANLCRDLLHRGARVVAMEGPSMQSWRLHALKNVKLVHVDLCEESAVKKLVQRVSPSAIFHCAAYGAYSQQTDVARTYQVNVEGTRHLLEAAATLPKLRAFIQAGSSSEYGINCTRPREDAPTWPDSHYAVSKVAAAALIRFFAVKHKLPGFVLRLYSVYGPLEDGSRLIPRLLNAALQGALPPLVNPDISRDFIFTDDVCAAFARVLERAPRLTPGDIFNIGAGKKITLRQLVSVARKEFGVKTKPDFGSMPNRHWDHADWYADARKSREVLGWHTRATLAEGLRQTATWMAEHPRLVSAAEQFSVVKVTR